MRDVSHDCAGFCGDCGREHVLPAAPAVPYALELMSMLERHGHIGLGLEASDSRLALDYLFGPARGLMFGVLVYADRAGNRGLLRAFSGQYNGIWNVPGWVAPILDPEEFARTIEFDEPRIKELTRRMQGLGLGDPDRLTMLAERRELSRSLMARIFSLYRLRNFRGQTRLLADVFQGTSMSTGTGECCAPKLLHHAAVQGLTPLGLAEFYVGRENRSVTRRHGRFFAPCAEKCRPILGFMLCGLNGKTHGL